MLRLRRPYTTARSFSRLTLAVACACTVSGCKPYRIEYHKRQAFYEKAVEGELPDEVTLDDGTVVRYSTYGEQSTMGRSGDDKHKPFLIREEMEDGSIVLRALLPEHVLLNTLECLRQEEYDLLWEQMMSDRVKEQWEESGKGKDGCDAYFRKNRHELVASMTRMAAGLPGQEVRFDPLGNGVTRCRLRPQHVGKLKFTYIDVVKEGPGLKLLMIGAK
jgi:hypothetical protein